jgi:hypothetical protein
MAKAAHKIQAQKCRDKARERICASSVVHPPVRGLHKASRLAVAFTREATRLEKHGSCGGWRLEYVKVTFQHLCLFCWYVNLL